jgi:hypothetical protein
MLQKPFDTGLGGGALREIGERQDDEAGIRLGEPVDEAVAGDRGDAGNAGCPAGDILDPLDRRHGAVDRGAIRQLHLDEDDALVLGRQEARGHLGGEPARAEDEAGEQHEADGGDPDVRATIAA